MCRVVVNDELIKQTNRLEEPNGACVGANLRMYIPTIFLYGVAQNQLSMDALIREYFNTRCSDLFSIGS